MSTQVDLANEVCTMIAARATLPPEDDDGFALAIQPSVQMRVDVRPPPIGQRMCFVQPVGFSSERINRGNDRTRVHYIDIILLETCEFEPMSDAGRDWLMVRAELLEQVEALDFSSITAATWEDSQAINLLYEDANADDDFVWFQVIRLEFSE